MSVARMLVDVSLGMMLEREIEDRNNLLSEKASSYTNEASQKTHGSCRKDHALVRGIVLKRYRVLGVHVPAGAPVPHVFVWWEGDVHDLHAIGIEAENSSRE